MSKHNRKGRNKNGKFVILTEFMTKSDAWKDLRPPEIAIYLLLSQRYNGSNNGYISLSIREAKEEAHIAPGTAKKAFCRLQELGFIKCRLKGSFSVKTRKASEWELTFWKGKTGKPATHDYRKWKPEKKNTGTKSKRDKVKKSNVLDFPHVTGTNC